jgi:hypothetical protein
MLVPAAEYKEKMTVEWRKLQDIYPSPIRSTVTVGSCRVRLQFRTFSVRVSTETAVVLIGDIHRLPQSLPGKYRDSTRVGNDHFLPYPFQFIIHPIF